MLILVLDKKIQTNKVTQANVIPFTFYTDYKVVQQNFCSEAKQFGYLSVYVWVSVVGREGIQQYTIAHLSDFNPSVLSKIWVGPQTINIFVLFLNTSTGSYNIGVSFPLQTLHGYLSY